MQNQCVYVASSLLSFFNLTVLYSVLLVWFLPPLTSTLSLHWPLWATFVIHANIH